MVDCSTILVHSWMEPTGLIKTYLKWWLWKMAMGSAVKSVKKQLKTMACTPWQQVSTITCCHWAQDWENIKAESFTANEHPKTYSHWNIMQM